MMDAKPAVFPDVLDVAGARLALRRRGKGPPVVCLHATGHGARDFDDVARRLGDAFEIIALDWPGQGDSPAEAPPPSAERYEALLAGALDALGLERAVILGNSIGAAAAIRFADAQPGRVRGLVLCNAGGLFRVNAFVRWYCRGLARRFAAGARGDRRFPQWFAQYYARLLPSPAARWRRDEIVASGPSVARLLALAWEGFAKPEADIRDRAARLSVPVLYAWGKRDRALPWFIARRAALRAPRAQVALFDAGHAPFLEQPDAFETCFRAFAGALAP